MNPAPPVITTRVLRQFSGAAAKTVYMNANTLTEECGWRYHSCRICVTCIFLSPDVGVGLQTGLLVPCSAVLHSTNDPRKFTPFIGVDSVGDTTNDSLKVGE